MLNSLHRSLNTNSAIYLHQTNGVFIDVVVTSSAVSSNGPYVLYADFSTDAFLLMLTTLTETVIRLHVQMLVERLAIVTQEFNSKDLAQASRKSTMVVLLTL